MAIIETLRRLGSCVKRWCCPRPVLYGGLLVLAWLCPINSLRYRLILCAVALLELVAQWWFDASAKALAEGHRDYVFPIGTSGTIQ
ncbi:MAG: hypothetical protein PHR35_13740 [Kiritimatiellae bacterium]|nr:hypothetical protein [Kiritimatiellia bacterium]